MKQTSKFKLNLVEASDSMSMKPLNENAEKIESAFLAQESAFNTSLLAQQSVIAGKLVMATGKYVGKGTRSVTIQTPGFKAKALLLRYAADEGWMRRSLDEAWWVGSDVPVSYKVTSKTDKYEEFAWSYKENITFVATNGSLSWSVPELPPEHYDISADGRPYVVCNSEGTSYEWIAFGTAE